MATVFASGSAARATSNEATTFVWESFDPDLVVPVDTSCPRVLFWEFEENLDFASSRMNIWKFIESLPDASRVKQWAQGRHDKAYKGWVRVHKGWHQATKLHFTADMVWISDNYTTRTTFATAHIFKDGHEEYFHCVRGTMEERFAGTSTYLSAYEAWKVRREQEEKKEKKEKKQKQKQKKKEKRKDQQKWHHKLQQLHQQWEQKQGPAPPPGTLMLQGANKKLQKLQEQRKQIGEIGGEMASKTEMQQMEVKEDQIDDEK